MQLSDTTEQYFFSLHLLNRLRHIIQIQVLLVVLFALFKLCRAAILASTDDIVIEVITLSLPNLFEAVLGILVLTSIGLLANTRLAASQQISRYRVYRLAALLAAIYVLTQEFKLHNLGGNNVFDPFDVLFSVIGLSLGYLLVLWLRPQGPEEDRSS